MGKSSKTIVVAARVTPYINNRLHTIATNLATTKTEIIIRALERYIIAYQLKEN